MKHSRQCFMGYPNTSNFVKNTPLRVVFSILFLVFGYPDETLSLVFDILLKTPFSFVVLVVLMDAFTHVLLRIYIASSRFSAVV